MSLPPDGTNSLTGTIPPSVGQLNGLEVLLLDQYNGGLTGSIPTSLGLLGSLIRFDLSFNKLTGTIPASLVNLKHLTDLDLSHNLLTGVVPPLPFAQYKDDNGGTCSLSRIPAGEPETNHFKCPLPAGSAQCKFSGLSGEVSGISCGSYD
jgi:hypothetical protein